ncbi:C2 calcium/lipid-binding domain CaLB [Penicillium taxi]|uniref:C2 calcium/lipid-binding domain CaLB n=1 Tax=Penicillium taxi TaxID=168475 RepID=UPI0025451FEB|nr:C2 calcium/lipid-binding domain CaLB [Penicillium taxi]KAJ5893517.1 C2 calcium/lipid-binding domain CaLB [Penicillium taxi]
MDGDELIASVYHKIEREKALIAAASNMRQSTDNPLVQQRVDANIRDGRKNIAYLEEKMQELQLRRMGQDGGGSPSDRRAQGSGPPPPPKDHEGDAGYPQGGSGSMPSGAPYADPRPYAPIPKPRPNYTKLGYVSDLIKYDTHYLGPKIQLMLSQLEFKLSVEKQYKAGIEKMVRLYQDEGDRKSRADAEGRRVESNQKIQLLKQALKRYEDLHVDIESADAADDESLSSPNMRKPLTGLLTMRIHAVEDVDHANSSRFSRGPETFIIVKVEDAIKARTKASRNDKWLDEAFSIDIDKANEIELTVYDKAGERPTPIGMLWVRISDIAEEMRRKKIETELNASGWVSADKMNNSGAPRPDNHPGSQPGSSGGFGDSSAPMGQQGDMGNAPPAVMIDSWFALEPFGRIHLSMSFAKQLKDRRPFDIGLNRQGAVRQKKEEVHEKQGHKFVTQQFYNIMRCALCGEFLKYAAGMQCSDCKYTCHRKCYPKVVTKCISKANYETDPDEEKINHRIPHRFDTFSNLSANWCCHCGYLLPFGRKSAKRCTECALTCHAQCTHLVPDFCGMSMEAANQILETLIRAKNHNKSTSVSSGVLKPTLRSGGPPQPSQDNAALSYPQKPNDRPYGELPRLPSSDAVGAATNTYATPQSPGASYAAQQRQPPPKSPTASDAQRAAAAAAAAAAGGKAPPRQQQTPSMSPLPVHLTRFEETNAFVLADMRSPVSPQQPPPPQHAPYDPGAYAKVNPQMPAQPLSPMAQPGAPPSSYGMPPPQQQQQQCSRKPCKKSSAASPTRPTLLDLVWLFVLVIIPLISAPVNISSWISVWYSRPDAVKPKFSFCGSGMLDFLGLQNVLHIAVKLSRINVGNKPIH